MSEFEVGDMVWARCKVLGVDRGDANRPIRVHAYAWPRADDIRRDEPASPTPPSGKFRVRVRGDRVLWVRTFMGINGETGVPSIYACNKEADAFVFPSRYLPVFDFPSFEIVPLALHSRPWEWVAKEKVIQSASGEFVASFSDETEHLGPLIVERVNKAEK